MRLTQSELGGKEFTKSFISQVEKGHTRPSLRSLQIIAARLNQPLSVFLGENEPAWPESQLLLEVDAAGAYHAQGRLQEAVDYYERALSHAPASDHRTKADIYYRLGHIYHTLEHRSRGIDSLILCVGEASRANSHELHVRALKELGRSYLDGGDLQSAQHALSQALALLPKMPIPDPQLHLSLLDGLASVHIRRKEYQEAYRVLKDAIELSKSDLGGHYVLASLCHRMGRICFHLDLLDEAVSYTQKTIILFQLAENTLSELDAKIDYAMQLRRMGETEKAIHLLDEIHKAAIDLGHTQVAARAVGTRAEISFSEGDYQGAIAHLQHAVELDSSLSNAPQWVQIATDCVSHIELPNELVQRLNSLAPNRGDDPRALAELHASLGELFLRIGDEKAAGHHLSQSVALLKRTS